MTGRPSSFTQKAADEICRKLIEGKSLRSICKSPSAPSLTTVMKWRRDIPEFAAQYTRAREDQADTLADEIVQIADTEKDAKRAAVRIDARKWAASKLKSKAYGDKITAEHTGKGGGPIETKTTHDLGASIAFALRKAAKS